MKKIYEWIDSAWGWVSRLVFVRFQFDLPVEEIKNMHQTGRLVFAIVYGGFIEWLILSSWSRTQGLGAILVANRKRILCLAKPLYYLQILFRQRTYTDLYLSKEPGPRLFVCPSTERTQLFVPTPAEVTLADLHSRLTAEHPGLVVHIVPVTIRWRKFARAESRTLSEVVLGLSSNPNWLGKFWYLLRKRNDSTVRSIESIAIPTPHENTTDASGESESLKTAKSIRRKILISSFQEMRIVLGPRYESPVTVKEILMRDPDIQKAIDEISEKEGIDKRKAAMHAYQYLTEIAANYRFRFIELMFVFLTWLFNKVFDGLDTRKEDLLTVRETLKNKPVVFVSSHRSHLDYLVVPYVLFLEDMVPPFIAAGINLSFWPIGSFLRRGGAFFIRRSFRGNLLYTICLRKYIEYLLKNRFTIKFFIEGTRSRSGKMLPPAYGLLKMITDVQQRHVVDDIALVPVSLCYDEVLEERSYTKELAGADKETESAGTLLKSRKLIKRNIGKVYVRFAKPIFLKELAQISHAQGLDPTLTLQKTAFQICKTINDVSPITAKSIVSSIMLSHREGNLSLEETLQLGDWMSQYAITSQCELATKKGETFLRAIEQTVRRLQKTGAIEKISGVPRTYRVAPNRRSTLNFYKNSNMHCFSIPSILLLSFFHCLKQQEKSSTESIYDFVIREAASLRNILKFEFFFSPTPIFINELDRALKFFFGEEDWKVKTGTEWRNALRARTKSWDDLSIYLNLLGDILESYLTSAHFLKENAGSTLDKKLLGVRLLKYGTSLFDEGNVFFQESLSIQNYSNSLLLFENFSFLNSTKAEGKPALKIGAWNEEMALLTKQIQGYLDIMSEGPGAIAG